MQTSTLPSLGVDPSTSRTSPSEQLENSVVMAVCIQNGTIPRIAQTLFSLFCASSIAKRSTLLEVMMHNQLLELALSGSFLIDSNSKQ